MPRLAWLRTEVFSPPSMLAFAVTLPLALGGAVWAGEVLTADAARAQSALSRPVAPVTPSPTGSSSAPTSAAPSTVRTTAAPVPLAKAPTPRKVITHTSTRVVIVQTVPPTTTTVTPPSSTTSAPPTETDEDSDTEGEPPGRGNGRDKP